MAIFEEEEIAGAFLDQKFVCWETCLTEEEMDAITQDCLITQDHIDKGGKRFFCDRCGKQMP